MGLVLPENESAGNSKKSLLYLKVETSPVTELIPKNSTIMEKPGYKAEKLKIDPVNNTTEQSSQNKTEGIQAEAPNLPQNATYNPPKAEEGKQNLTKTEEKNQNEPKMDVENPDPTKTNEQNQNQTKTEGDNQNLTKTEGEHQNLTKIEGEHQNLTKPAGEQQNLTKTEGKYQNLTKPEGKKPSLVKVKEQDDATQYEGSGVPEDPSFPEETEISLLETTTATFDKKYNQDELGMRNPSDQVALSSSSKVFDHFYFPMVNVVLVLWLLIQMYPTAKRFFNWMQKNVTKRDRNTRRRKKQRN